MRDFRDAKAMAQTLRETLAAKSTVLSHSESLELVSKMLGVADWNTLSALLQVDRPEAATPGNGIAGAKARYPALPTRDFVPFPTLNFQLFVGREKTKRALDEAFARHRDIVLIVQKDPAVEEPGLDDVHEIGVLARLLELEPLPDGTKLGDQEVSIAGATRILVQAQRRVRVQSFIGEGGAFQAEFTDISEGPIPDAPERIQTVVELFRRYASARGGSLPQTWPPLDQIRDPGWVADIITAHLNLPIGDKQNFLATIDPMERIENVASLLEFLVIRKGGRSMKPILSHLGPLIPIGLEQDLREWRESQRRQIQKVSP